MPMRLDIGEQLSRHVFHPLWDLKDRSKRLQHWRELEGLQWQPRDVLAARQWTEFRHTLEYAARHSPFYRERFRQLGITPSDIRVPADVVHLPVTTKRDIRENIDAFISDEYRKADLVQAKTGGSTGFSLDLYFDRLCQERRNAAQILADRWSGWDLGRKTAAIWGNPPVARTFKQKLRSACIERTIYLDTMALNHASMANFVQRWRQERPEAIFGHAHSIYVLAAYLRETGATDLRPRSVVATSMMLLAHERRLIEAVFDQKVTNRYGCEEVGLIACECERHEGMHLNTLHLLVEATDEQGRAVPTGSPGKLLLTDLNNRGMPLIRYRVEDVGVLSDRACACGRGLPMLERIEGRTADFLRAQDGTLVAGVSLIERTLTDIPGLEQIQLIQEEALRLVVNRVKAKDHATSSDDALVAELKTALGRDMAICIVDADRIVQESNGKFRFSICRLGQTLGAATP